MAKEIHRDGGEHFHTFGQCGKKFNFRNSRVFDINGFHPNIAKITAGTRDRVINYIKKDGDFIETGYIETKLNQKRRNNIDILEEYLS